MVFKKAQLKRIPILSLLLAIGIIFYLSFVMGYVTLTDITNLPSPFITSNQSILLEYNLSDSNNEGISSIVWSWDNQNYSIFDSSLVLFYNFDNRTNVPCGGDSSENDTCVADLSMYGNNGTVSGATFNSSVLISIGELL
jgi:hypothetical protein